MTGPSVEPSRERHGGDLVVDVLERQGVRRLYTLCGGHVSPILVAAEERGIAVLDVRDEASAAFAADAESRLTGIPGVCVVTAGPGCTNTITAVKNAQLAQSPLVLIGGATGTFLRGRGSLQDIDQRALFEPHVKWMATVERVRDLGSAMEQAFEEARLGVPGPVFVECPVDLLYPRDLVRGQYGVGDDAKPPRGFGERAVRWVLGRHVKKIFQGADEAHASSSAGTASSASPSDAPLPIPKASTREIRKIAKAVRKAKRPVALVGSQAALRVDRIDEVATSLGGLGIPFYLSGMARGLVGKDHARQMRHKRRMALREADFVLLCGVPADFRLDYGRHVPRKATLVSVNLSDEDLTKNRKPDLGVLADPGLALIALADELGKKKSRSRDDWITTLRARDDERNADIAARAEQSTEHVNPLQLFRVLESLLGDDSVLVADGGDFVATASYILQPRGPLRWLDPGVFGTLGVGGGFALGAKAVRPESEVWLIWGDGSAAYSLAELDAYARHGLPVIALVGNDAGWTQIAREQVEILGAATATELVHNDYHVVAEGYGGVGLKLDDPAKIEETLREARRLAAEGKPVLINVLLGATDFRKGSISM